MSNSGVNEIGTGRPIDEIRLVGGRRALDFVNTIHDRHASDLEDYLSDGDRYLAWSRRAGLLTQSEARQIGRRDLPASLLGEMRGLREHLYRLFTARIDGRRPDRASLAALDAWLQRAWSGQTLAPDRDDWLRWRSEAVDATLPLRVVALSALDILQHCSSERLKRCSAENECGWLFVDDSKNNARRWCSMDTCGARAKMRRYRST
ncbi:MAG: ABATE domain-containing protein [Myxococcales bacterium]|nr:ABATE domain-containing protein [Myxococcales bacterium]